MNPGPGNADQPITQAAAIAVQDAADALRNATLVATAASATALAQFLASGDPRFLEALPHAHGMVERAIDDFAAIGRASIELLGQVQHR